MSTSLFPCVLKQKWKEDTQYVVTVSAQMTVSEMYKSLQERLLHGAVHAYTWRHTAGVFCVM